MHLTVSNRTTKQKVEANIYFLNNFVENLFHWFDKQIAINKHIDFEIDYIVFILQIESGIPQFLDTFYRHDMIVVIYEMTNFEYFFLSLSLG